MKLMKLSTFLLSACCSFALASCSNSDDNEPDSPQGTAVKSLEASINFNLENRSDWTLSFSGFKYDININGKMLTATAIDKPFLFNAGITEANGANEIYFCSPLYGTLFLESENGKGRAMAKPFYIGDQTTEEKVAICDALRGPYAGKVSNHLKGITLYHMNALLDFTLSNIPDNAQILIHSQVGQDRYIKPWRKENSCKAIVLPYCDTKDLSLIIKTGNKTYETLIPWTLATEKERATRSLPTQFFKLGNSTWLQFQARINAEDELIIEDMSIEPWSKRWPLAR